MLALWILQRTAAWARPIAVRSSVARRLGVGKQDGPHAPRNVEGLLDSMDDAVKRCHDALTHERLYAWHAALFPTAYSGMTKIHVSGYRHHGEPMQIVSGRAGREKVHYEAPPSSHVPHEMGRFLQWFNAAAEPDTLVRAALAHLWFETAASGAPWSICCWPVTAARPVACFARRSGCSMVGRTTTPTSTTPSMAAST